MQQYMTILYNNIAPGIVIKENVTILLTSLTIPDNTKKYCAVLSVLSNIVRFCQVLSTIMSGIGLQMRPGVAAHRAASTVTMADALMRGPAA
jgi:hypothetical protein